MSNSIGRKIHGTKSCLFEAQCKGLIVRLEARSVPCTVRHFSFTFNGSRGLVCAKTKKSTCSDFRCQRLTSIVRFWQEVQFLAESEISFNRIIILVHKKTCHQILLFPKPISRSILDKRRSHRF